MTFKTKALSLLSNRWTIALIFSFFAGALSRDIVARRIPNGPPVTAHPLPVLVLDGLGHKSEWSLEEERPVLDSGYRGYVCMIHRLQGDYESQRVLSADLHLLAKFQELYDADPFMKEKGEVADILKHFIRSKRLEFRKAVATSILYDFQSVRPDVQEELLKMNLGGDAYLGRIVAEYRRLNGETPPDRGKSSQPDA